MTRSVEVIRAGMLSTVQDAGRRRHRSDGVAACGALDSLGFAVANLLAGNERDAAAIEITMGNAAFCFSEVTRFALAGADANAALDGMPVAPWSCATADAGQTLELGAPLRGTRSILAIGGGIDVPLVLGSRSTDLQAGFGGLEGRALRRGDRLPLGNAAAGTGGMKLRVKPPQWEFGATEIGVLPGPEYWDFTTASQDAVWTTPWKVAPQSNRMGYRLEGFSLQRTAAESENMLSAAVFPGVIQVPPSGSPIVLLNDAQTTGGYPRIGVVRHADRWKLAGVAPDDRIRFVRSTLQEAEEAALALARYVGAVEAAIATRMNS